MKEFLTYLYNACAYSNQRGVDAVWQVIANLTSEKKYDALNGLLRDLDFKRVDLSTLFCMITLIVNHKDKLSEYKSFYTKCREEYARRGEDSTRIGRLFDKYDPEVWVVENRDGRQTLDEREESDWQKLDEKIAWAKKTGDKDLIHYLEVYKLYKIGAKEREDEYRQLRLNVGEEEIRKRAIKSLREMADTLEKSEGCWPGIYYAKLPGDPLFDKTFIDGIEVIISYPWPG